MARKYIVAGNWKMNNHLDQAQKLASEVIHMIYQNSPEHVEVMMAPPALFARTLVSMLDANNSAVSIGVQNCHHLDSGAYTGEISAGMAKSIGIKYAIIGHSERREYFNETDQMVLAKTQAAIKAGLIPMVCVGESLSERESGKFKEVIAQQLQNGLFELDESDFSQVVIAYEPVWAIGTGKTASPEQAQEVHAFIRESVKNKYGQACADDLTILYGGSCKPDNANEIFKGEDVDGGLIGGASLKSKDFVSIASALNQSVKNK